jgi:histidinol dehydrogenase
MKTYIWNRLSPEEQAALLRRPALADGGRLQAEVAAILSRVRERGDAALRELTEELDGIRLGDLAVSETELAAAEARLDPEQRAAIQAAAGNIEAFHAAQLPVPVRVETQPGVRCERLTRPIARVGLYVPAGNAPLPSTALMLGIPAELAGCGTRILCSPPQADGQADPAVLYAAGVCGISRVFKLGGAQAIAAMAYGTETVPKVDKLFGPGNAWVTAAKALAALDPLGAARDMPAGPTEVLVIADEGANPAFVASDLLSQAEHGVDSQVVLVTTSETLAAAVTDQVDLQQQGLSRLAIIRESLSHSCTILVDDVAAALQVANQYAPEHLIIQVENPHDWLDRVEAAGSVFLGPWAPESVGDYCSGTNHVLPTYGFARSYSSLSVNDFLRSMTVQTLTPAGLVAIGPIAATLAELEGLDGHRQAVQERLAVLTASGEEDAAS